MTKEHISMQDVQRLSALSRIDLTQEQAKALQGDLEKILLHVDQLSSVDTAGIEAYVPEAQSEDCLRADVVVPSLPVDAALAAAPERLGDGFGVPKILD